MVEQNYTGGRQRILRENLPIPPERLRYLARRIHALGERLIAGKIHGEPVVKPTRTGGEFTAFKLRVANGNTVEWWSVTTFDEAARREVATLHDGDAISAVGALSVETYEAKDGSTRIAFRLTADRILPLKARRAK